MNPLIQVLVSDGVDSVVRGILSQAPGAITNSEFADADQIEYIWGRLRLKGYNLPPLDDPDFQQFANNVYGSFKLGQRLNSGRGNRAVLDAPPLFPGADPQSTRYTYAATVEVRYPDGTTAEAYLELGADRRLTAADIRREAINSFEERLSITSFPGERQNENPTVTRVNIVSAFRGEPFR